MRMDSAEVMQPLNSGFGKGLAHRMIRAHLHARQSFKLISAVVSFCFVAPDGPTTPPLLDTS